MVIGMFVQRQVVLGINAFCSVPFITPHGYNYSEKLFEFFQELWQIENCNPLQRRLDTLTGIKCLFSLETSSCSQNEE